MVKRKTWQWRKQGGLILAAGLLLAAVAGLAYWGVSRLDRAEPFIQLKPEPASGP